MRSSQQEGPTAHLIFRISPNAISLVILLELRTPLLELRTPLLELRTPLLEPLHIFITLATISRFWRTGSSQQPRCSARESLPTRATPRTDVHCPLQQHTKHFSPTHHTTSDDVGSGKSVCYGVWHTTIARLAFTVTLLPSQSLDPLRACPA
jgi:hypothetical protein